VNNPPGYWMNEMSGDLRPVIEAYLHGRELTPEQCAIMRVYLWQWIMHPAWTGVEELRSSIEGLTSNEAIDQWLEQALVLGIDPL
jgi:hypothetical protein